VKIDRHGKARCLEAAEIQLLFDEGLQTIAHRCLFGICLYTAARINESCTLRRADVFDKSRRVRPELMIRKSNSKGKLATRSVPIGEDLRALLTEYNPPSNQWFLFPGRHGRGHMRPDSASRILREAMNRIGLGGVSPNPRKFRQLARCSIVPEIFEAV